MPIQIWEHDRVPELTLRGASGLGEGIAAAGQDFGAAIGKRLEESKRLNTAGKAAKTFLDVLNDASEDDEDTKGFQKLANANLSNRDAIARMTGMLQAQGYQTAQGHFKDALTRATAGRLANEGTSAMPAFMNKLSEVLQGGTSAAPAAVQSDYYENPERYSAAPEPSEQDALAAALKASPSASMSPQFDNSTTAILRAFQQRGSADSGPLMFEEDPVTGSRFARRKNTVMPSGVNPAKQNLEGHPQYDEDDNLLGYSFPNGKGGFTFKPKVDLTPQPLLHPGTGQPIPGWLKIGGKAVDVRTIMQKAGLGQPTETPAGAAAQFKKGQHAVQGGVTYEFDGKNWNPVK